MAFGDEDLGVFFDEFSVAVAFGGNNAKGNFDRPLEIKLGSHGFGGVETELPAVRLPYNAFSPMPTNDDTITVDGTVYTVAEVTAEGDGSVVCIELKGT
jgi:hypothetical protein